MIMVLTTTVIASAFSCASYGTNSPTLVVLKYVYTSFYPEIAYFADDNTPYGVEKYIMA